ncbi:MAG: hypothetical protein GXY38_13590 [Planctomycetes bacterium]|jgi:hypothetical protein|nr:hypothetical protein [Planctomycetota bacterium]
MLTEASPCICGIAAAGLRTAVLLCAACATIGCEPTVERPEVASYLRSEQDLQRIQRVVLVEFSDEKAGPEACSCFTDRVVQALSQRRLFHVELLPVSDPTHQLLPPGRRSPLTVEELQQIRQTLRVDAVLLGMITSYKTYPHMQIGVYLRLLDLKNGRVIWSVDDIWDAQNKQVEKRIKRYFRNNVADKYEPVDWRLATISPTMFQKFVAHEIARTLPGDDSDQKTLDMDDFFP